MSFLRSTIHLALQRAMYEGRQRGYEDEVRRFQQELRSDMYKNAEEKYRQKVIAMKVSRATSTSLFPLPNGIDSRL